MPRKDIKADLSLLKELVDELEKQLDEAYLSRDKLPEDKDGVIYRKFIIDLSKAAGLLSGIANESSLLVGDLSKIMRLALESSEDSDPMNQINSLLKSKFGSTGNGGMRN